MFLYVSILLNEAVPQFIPNNYSFNVNFNFKTEDEGFEQNFPPEKNV